MHVVSTAGHVDHGKSTLINALTGIDPDRLDEEKQRGLTIDLGFAWLGLASGREVGIVDVPGHERFIKNMLAGVGAINVTLFVVAANEGWKPQSQEHLEILDLLGVNAAVVVITKADLADPARIQDVISEVTNRIAGTTLAGSPVVAVSAVTGRGLDELLMQIDALISRTPAAADRGRARLWIDRVFTMKGSGTVVTGTLVDGALEVEQEIEVLPTGGRARIRSIQSHRRKLDRVGPGNRTALNLAGIAPTRLERGEVIAPPGKWLISNRALVALQFVSRIPFEPTTRGAFKFHAGSAERDARIAFLDGPPGRGGRCLALVKLNKPLVLDWRDRFVLREAGRSMTVGGGVILEAAVPLGRGASGLLEAGRRRDEAASREEYLALLLEEEGSLDRRQIFLRTGLDLAPDQTEGRVWLRTTVHSRRHLEELTKALVEAVERYLTENPLAAGMPREAARALLADHAGSFDELLKELTRLGLLVAGENLISTPGHRPDLTGPERSALIAELEAAGASPPALEELERRFDPALIKGLIVARELIQVASNLVYPVSRFEWITATVSRHMSVSGSMTVAQFRDLISTTRKYAVPLLEYLDQIGLTRRQGELRVPGPHAR